MLIQKSILKGGLFVNFNIFRTSDSSTFKKITQKKSKFLSSSNEVDLFHVNKLSSKQIHVVFFISDEYNFGAKKSGEFVTVPFNQYINAFLFSDSPFILVESINNNYSELVVKYLENITASNIELVALSNKQLLSIVKLLDSIIKEIEYEDKNNETQISNKVNSDLLEQIFQEDHDISYLLLNIDNKLFSVKNKTTISINNNDEDYLINFTEDLVNAIG